MGRLPRTRELTVDPYLAVEEVDLVDAQAEALALPESCTGGKEDECSVQLGTRSRQRLPLIGRERHDLTVVPFGERDLVAGDAAISWSPTVALKMGATQR